MLLVKFYNPSSSYKKRLLSLERGETIVASQLAGDFVLPKDTTKPLVFIAGGVGIAPFRSIIAHMIEKNLKRDIVLVYVNRDKTDILFADIFTKAEARGVRSVYVLTNKDAVPQDWKGKVGHISKEMVAEEISDFAKRTFYISGPQPMVQSTEAVLLEMAIPRKHIVTDYFPGYENI